VCRPKDQGGLGIINSRYFNAALMVKWIWQKNYPAEQDNLSYKLLRAKYLNVDNIFVHNSHGGSQFWRSINKIKHLFKLGAKYHLGSGERIFFWTDWWQGEGPLAIRFPRLFDICSSKTILVAQALPISPATLQFRRSFGPEEVEAWELLVQDLRHVHLSTDADQVKWALEPGESFLSSRFTAKSIKAPASHKKSYSGKRNSL
jgi:hypothetical protein